MDLQGGGIQGPSAGAACPAEGVAGRHILLGITGSIAAYKAAVLCRLLRTAGAEVRVVMTPLAKQFITPLTMATLSRNPILVEFFDPENGAWNSHVSLGEWADCYLIAPVTANTLAKMACGIADNLLLTTYLSARCPVVVAPAMDLDMYAHPTTQENLRRLACETDAYLYILKRYAEATGADTHSFQLRGVLLRLFLEAWHHLRHKIKMAFRAIRPGGRTDSAIAER